MSVKDIPAISRDDAALAMIIVAAEKQNILFSRSGIHASPTDAMMFQNVVQDLLKVSTFCLNMHAELNFKHRGARKTSPGEDVLLVAGMDYALDIAPRLEDPGPEGQDIIDIDDLRSFVSRIEGAFGVISIDMSFPEDIRSSLKFWIETQLPEPATAQIKSN